MKQMRTVIERYPDGHLAVKREVLHTNDRGGTAHERKLAKKNPPQPEWVRAECKIVRSDILYGSTVEQAGVEVLPASTPEIAAQAESNEELAGAFTCEALQRTLEIAARADAFAHDPQRGVIRKVKMVALVYEDGSVEPL